MQEARVHASKQTIDMREYLFIIPNPAAKISY
jgi:hypothetical protein